MKTTPFWWPDKPEQLGSETPLGRTYDVAVVGGGYTGLSAAYSLTKTGRSAIVFDAADPSQGASTMNGGQCTDTLKVSASGLVDRFGSTFAARLLKEARLSLRYLEELIAAENIACHFTKSGHILCAEKQTQFDAMWRDTELLNKLGGYGIEVLGRSDLRKEISSDVYVGGRLNSNRAVVHPFELHRGLRRAAQKNGAIILGNARVRSITRGSASYEIRLADRSFNAGKVIIATNGYTGSATPAIRRSIVPISSYVIATEPLPASVIRSHLSNLRSYADANRMLHYFRASPDGTRILFGGRPAYTDIPPNAAASKLLTQLCRIFPDLSGVTISHCWTGNIGFTRDSMPHVGTRGGMYYAVGCCGSGIAMLTWLGHKAAEAIVNSAFDSAFAEVEMPVIPFYWGRPWFLPIAQGWHSLADRWGA